LPADEHKASTPKCGIPFRFRSEEQLIRVSEFGSPFSIALAKSVKKYVVFHSLKFAFDTG